MRLFSYCIPVDDGAAPNPFWGVCTLTVCKPKIRSTAKKNDWVLGMGSVNVGGRNYSGRLVYAMKITDVMSLQDYNDYCLEELSGKIPDFLSKDYKKRVGDCIYSFSDRGLITQRDGVHNEEHIQRDLGGKNALLSTHFFYFGVNAVKVPARFSVLIRQGRSHQSIKNEEIKESFVKWLEGTYEKNVIYGEPQVELIFEKDVKGNWCRSSKCNFIIPKELRAKNIGPKKLKNC